MIVERKDLPPNVDVVRMDQPGGSVFYVPEGATDRLIPLLAVLGSRTAMGRMAGTPPSAMSF